MASQGCDTRPCQGATRSSLEVQVGSLVYGCQTLESNHNAQDSPEAEKEALISKEKKRRNEKKTRRRELEQKGKNLNAGAARSASRSVANLSYLPVNAPL